MIDRHGIVAGDRRRIEGIDLADPGNGRAGRIGRVVQGQRIGELLCQAAAERMSGGIDDVASAFGRGGDMRLVGLDEGRAEILDHLVILIDVAWKEPREPAQIGVPILPRPEVGPLERDDDRRPILRLALPDVDVQIQFLHAVLEILVGKILPLRPAEIDQRRVDGGEFIVAKQRHVPARQARDRLVFRARNLRRCARGLIGQFVVGICQPGDGRVFPIFPGRPIDR